MKKKKIKPNLKVVKVAKVVLRVTIKHSDATVKVAGVASSTACAASVELPATQPSVPATAVKTMNEKRLLRLG